MGSLEDTCSAWLQWVKICQNQGPSCDSLYMSGSPSPIHIQDTSLNHTHIYNSKDAVQCKLKNLQKLSLRAARAVSSLHILTSEVPPIGTILHIQALAFAFAFGTASGTLPCGSSPTPMPGRLGPGSPPVGSPENAKDICMRGYVCVYVYYLFVYLFIYSFIHLFIYVFIYLSTLSVLHGTFWAACQILRGQRATPQPVLYKYFQCKRSHQNINATVVRPLLIDDVVAEGRQIRHRCLGKKQQRCVWKNICPGRDLALGGFHFGVGYPTGTLGL